MNNTKAEYEKRKKHFEKLMHKQTRNVNLISYLRLAAFIIGFGISIYLYIKKIYYVCTAVALLAAGMFMYLVIKHRSVIRNKAYSSVLVEINDNSIKRLTGEWKNFKDKGQDFADDRHNYSGDLDVFGQGSLFQWINVASTYLGRKRLNEIISAPCKDKGLIYRRQEALKELGNKLTWRQRFISEGIINAEKQCNPNALIDWGKEKSDFYTNKLMRIIFIILPIVSLTVLLLSFTGTVPEYLRSVAVIIQIVLLIPGYSKRAASMKTVLEHKKSIRSFEGLIRLVENGKFKSSYLKELQNRLRDGKKESASFQIKKLMRISDKIADRANFFFIVINILLLWDYQCMFELEIWKRRSGNSIKSWLDIIAELEALCSLSAISYDHPDWAMPLIEEKQMVLQAKELGHPLLSEKRVYNDLTIKQPDSILLITGSNMSGKSTLLRTAGINLVLAYAGAPVCAGEFRCSIMDIYTCMRISDNMEKNISSFYAEILRIKMIVAAVMEKRKIFFLLDEIFKGTNSIDRHMGAKILIRQLQQEGAIGMVSTHDLELGEMEKEESSEIRNYHLEEYYKNNELHFDYKLKPGISTTRNAMYLIKMAGISVNGVINSESDFSKKDK